MIRFFDIFLSSLGLIFLSPVFLIVTILLLFDSKGSAIYKQKRVGKDGLDFFLYKFRSMYINSDRHGLITVSNRDLRITRVGYYIRKYKLDELPQLFNVLIGDMSLVGPRPELREFVNLYTEEQKLVLSVRPGITDYASIRFRNENEILSRFASPEEYYINYILPEKLKFNMIFVKNQSLYQYFKIIQLTFILDSKISSDLDNKKANNKID